MAQVLSRVPQLASERVIVGHSTADDAGAVRMPDGSALVATVDFITPLVDDPATFGAIAAANAVSDVYAMGATPILALSIVCFPADDWSTEILGDVLAGGVNKLGEAGVPVIGGHSVKDEEFKMGYAVVGTAAEPDGLWLNCAARAGDRLILTKPLGTGILAAAARARKDVGASWDRAIEVMCTLNRTAAEAVDRRSVHAATDITGFGLVGHAVEIARASGVCLHVDAAAVPVLPDAERWAAAGFLTKARGPNRAYAVPELEIARSVDSSRQEVLLDAQTSGGLLLVVDADSDALDRLQHGGCADAVEIGRVEAGPARLVIS